MSLSPPEANRESVWGWVATQDFLGPTNWWWLMEVVVVVVAVTLFLVLSIVEARTAGKILIFSAPTRKQREQNKIVGLPINQAPIGLLKTRGRSVKYEGREPEPRSSRLLDSCATLLASLAKPVVESRPAATLPHYDVKLESWDRPSGTTVE